MKKNTKVFILLLATTTIQNVMAQKMPQAIYQNKSYTITADGVRQGKFSGKILSASQITWIEIVLHRNISIQVLLSNSASTEKTMK